MGANQSHPDDFTDEEEEEDEEEVFQDAVAGIATDSGKAKKADVPKKATKLYRFSGASNKYELADKLPSWKFVQLGAAEDDDEDEDEEGDSWKDRREKDDGKSEDWYLVVSKKIQARVDERLNVRYNDDQLRIDFASTGVWAIKFGNSAEYRDFVRQFSDCLFENNYGVKATETNKAKIIGKDFLNWAAGEDGDETMWDAEEDVEEDPGAATEKLAGYEWRETFRGTPKGRDAQSLTMGALTNSYLLHSTGLDVYKNREKGIEETELSIRFPKTVGGDSFTTPKKGMLIRGEATMMLMSPLSGLSSGKKKGAGGGGGAGGVQQLDIDTGKIVSNWEFQKDGTPISMLDIVNDSKSSQLDPTQSTFLGLDDNRLCRWDMRAREGAVQDLTAATSSPSVLSWSDGHQFSRGTNFKCFATTGDGSIVVGSRDGKVRLYGTTSMRQAKTAFPGLGSPITAVDVTYDGRWIVATTDTYVLVISAVFRDKDGKEKTGFQGRMGGQFGAPRLLKLSPQHAEKANKMGGGFKFQSAHFSWVTESDKAERNIVASVGQFSVVWNFRRVKQSDHGCYTAQGTSEGMKTCYCYKVSNRPATVVDSRFMHDSYMSAGSPDAPLVVATPQEVSSYTV